MQLPRAFRLFVSVLVTSLVVALTACGGPLGPAPTPTATLRAQKTLTISGSGTTTQVLEAVRSAFEAEVRGYKLEVLPGTGSSGGIKGILEGVLDVAALAKAPSKEEAAKGIEYVEFGQSPSAIFVHPSVTVGNLTTEQAIAIFSGQITNWSQVGGPNLAIVLLVRDESDSSSAALRKLVLGETPFAATARTLTSQTDMLAAVAAATGAVGYGAWTSVLATGTKVNPVAVNGVGPTDAAYTGVAGLGIGYMSNRKADVQPLLDWLISKPGQAALTKMGVIIKR
jgi:phosphate transport system substrate-binding protein